MKTKSNPRPPKARTERAKPRSVQRVVRALAEELWMVGYREKSRVLKTRPDFKYKKMSKDQHAAWTAIARHVLKMKRHNT